MDLLLHSNKIDDSRIEPKRGKCRLKDRRKRQRERRKIEG